MNKKKGMVWSMDIIFSVFVFVAAIFLFFEFNSNMMRQDDRIMEDLIYEARYISDNLMSEGSPKNWNITDINAVGIVEDGYRVNMTKVDMLSKISYYNLKRILGTTNDYYIFFRGSDNTIIPINSTLDGIGKEGINSTNIYDSNEAVHVVNVERVVFYNSTIAKMMVYVW